MVSKTASKLIGYVGKVKPTQISSATWRSSVEKFCEEFEKQASLVRYVGTYIRTDEH